MSDTKNEVTEGLKLFNLIHADVGAAATESKDYKLWKDLKFGGYDRRIVVKQTGRADVDLGLGMKQADAKAKLAELGIPADRIADGGTGKLVRIKGCTADDWGKVKPLFGASQAPAMLPEHMPEETEEEFESYDE